METYFLILLLVVAWIALDRKIGRVETKLDAFRKQQEENARKEKRDFSSVFSKTGTVLPPEIPAGNIPVSDPTGSEEAAYAAEKSAAAAYREKTNAEAAAVCPSSPYMPSAVPPPPPSDALPASPYYSSGQAESGSLTETVSAPTTEKTTSTAEAVSPPAGVTGPGKATGNVASPPAKKIDYEKYIGENLFAKFGILVLVVGIGLFVKYAIDKDWINETFRTILGFASGLVLLFLAERLQKKYRTFSSLLAGGAFAVFYVTVAIAFHFYGLFSQTAAFVILVAVTGAMAVLALLYDRRELAVIALIGGFIAPFLVSRGQGNYIVLFTYLAVLNTGMFSLSLKKKWPELPSIAFVFTYLVMFLYTYGLDPHTSDHDSGTIRPLFIRLFLFATLFYFIFLLPLLVILKDKNNRMNRMLLWAVVVNNFIYMAFGLYYLANIGLTVRLGGMLTLFVALVNLVLVVWLKKQGHDYRFLVYTMLGLVLTFVSLTVPIQLEGNYITLFWAAETVVLLWLYIKSKIAVYEYFTCLLIACTVISSLMDTDFFVFRFYSDWLSQGYILDGKAGVPGWNGTFATGLFTGLAFLVCALLIRNNRRFFRSARILHDTPWNGILLLLSVVWIYYYALNDLCLYLPARTNIQAMNLFTVFSVLALIYLFRKRLPVGKYKYGYLAAVTLATAICAAAGGGVIAIPSGQGTTVLPWLTLAVTGAALFYTGKLYYSRIDSRSSRSTGFTWYLQVLAVVWWLAAVAHFLDRMNLPDEANAGFSIALMLAGFAQMIAGMRFHMKVLRMISLCTFGIVLVKLLVADLWAMPTVGKILVFVLLGVILLLLSFLYQKLKDVLFKNDADSE